MRPKQVDLDDAVLLILYEESSDRSYQLTADQIASRLLQPVSHERVLMSLEHLAKQGFADSGGHWGRVAGYKITRAGVEYVEKRFEARHEADNTSYNRSSPANTERADSGTPVSQAKLDVAVLYKLHQHAEAGGGAVTSADLLRHFDIHIPVRRIELALTALETRQEVERTLHEHSVDGGFWQITREGMIRVDRALRVSTSFIARLHNNGDAWLQTDEAKQAVLKKLSDAQAKTDLRAPEISENLPHASPRAIDWTKWGTIIAGVSVAVSIVLWKLS